MQLIAGLGNPGQEYQDTRHNAGFWFVDRVARAGSVVFRSEPRFHGEVARVTLQGQSLWLLKPSTFMNDSGRAVGALARFYRIPPDQILVVHDELDLQPGSAKLKKGGGAAGHNGLRDLIAVLGTPDFWRLRLGIGHPGQRHEVVDFVLHRPSREDRDAIGEAEERALEALPKILRGEIEAAMRDLHRPSPSGEASSKG